MGLRSGLCKDQTIYATPNLEIPLLTVHRGGGGGKRHRPVETAKELTEKESWKQKTSWNQENTQKSGDII